MRKVIVSELLSLDGLLSDPASQMDWVLDIFNEEMAREIREQQSSIDTILLGRKTYEIMAAYWPAATPDKEDPVMIGHMHHISKIVFSTTLQQPVWHNTTIARRDPAMVIRRLKQQPGKDIAVLGSAGVVGSLIDLDLIDEYILMIHPLLLGNGKPLFPHRENRQPLRLMGHRALKNGVVVLHYSAR